MAASTSLTPEQRVERARKAGKASVSRHPTAYVTRVVKALTENQLSAEDRRRLQEALEVASR